MSKVCTACGKPLKDTTTVRKGNSTQVGRFKVCKSPICKKYGRPQ